jgi:hypothetical protein
VAQPLAVLACPLCGAANTNVFVSAFRDGGVRHNCRKLRCPSTCGSYQMHEAAYARLPFAPAVAASLARLASEVSSRKDGEQLDIDPVLVRFAQE